MKNKIPGRDVEGICPF